MSRGDNKKICKRIVIKMHRLENKRERKVKVLCKTHSQNPCPLKAMQRIK
jgi:hypothetical protein